jgi:hypothetical protein
MPLSAPTPRQPIHLRQISGSGYRRDDGLWDIEGRLVDTKYGLFPNAWRGPIPPGEPLHEMLVRLTIDNAMTVVAVESATDFSPYPLCGAILPNFERLIGQRIGGGWTKRVKALVGGPEGCAHHVELIGLLATVAFQTMSSILAAERRAEASRDSWRFVVDSCHLWKQGGELSRQFDHDPARAMTGLAPATPEPPATG